MTGEEGLPTLELGHTSFAGTSMIDLLVGDPLPRSC